MACHDTPDVREASEQTSERNPVAGWQPDRVEEWQPDRRRRGGASPRWWASRDLRRSRVSQVRCSESRAPSPRPGSAVSQTTTRGAPQRTL